MTLALKLYTYTTGFLYSRCTQRVHVLNWPETPVAIESSDSVACLDMSEYILSFQTLWKWLYLCLIWRSWCFISTVRHSLPYVFLRGFSGKSRSVSAREGHRMKGRSNQWIEKMIKKKWIWGFRWIRATKAGSDKEVDDDDRDRGSQYSWTTLLLWLQFHMNVTAVIKHVTQ